MPIEDKLYSEYYLFGSACHSTIYNDIDILILYDEKSIHPSQAYDTHGNAIRKLRTACNEEIHVLLLGKQEAANCHCVNQLNAVLLGEDISPEFLLDKLRKV